MKRATRQKRIVLIISGLVLMAAAFAVDAYTHRGVNDAMVYLPLILLTLFVSEIRHTVLAGLIATSLIAIGYLISPSGDGLHSPAITSRVLTIVSCWIIVALIVVYKRSDSRAAFYRERLSVLFEHAEEGIIIVTQEETITLANPKMAAMFGYEDGELNDKNFDHLLPSFKYGEDNSCSHELNLRDPLSFSGKELIFCARRKDGSVFPARVHIWHIELSGSKYFTFYIIDITEVMEQKMALEKAHEELLLHAEELKNTNTVLEDRVDARTVELRDTVDELQNINNLLQREMMNREEAVLALKERKMMLEAIATNFPNGILAVLDHDFCYVYERGKEVKKNGVYKGIPRGKMFSPLMDKEVNNQIRELLTKAFNGEKISFEYREPGSGSFYLYTAAPLPNVHNEIQQILVVSQNISKQKKAEYDIRKAFEKEKELNEMKSRFVSTASHEFRTPLAAIISSASLISMYQTTADEPKRQKHVTRITASVTNLTEILNDFLSLGKIEEGKVPNRPTEFNLIDLCDDVKEEIAGIAQPEQKILVNYNLTNTGVMMDKQLLRNVLINLLSNALKYSPQNATVYFDVVRNNGNLKISIRDQGIGIPDSDQKHLFQTFYRASNVENIKGTGMGLHIVKKYLEIMNGTIDFESELNKGTCFTICFNN